MKGVMTLKSFIPVASLAVLGSKQTQQKSNSLACFIQQALTRQVGPGI
jgi:hypothetical protein